MTASATSTKTADTYRAVCRGGPRPIDVDEYLKLGSGAVESVQGARFTGALVCYFDFFDGANPNGIFSRSSEEYSRSSPKCSSDSGTLTQRRLWSIRIPWQIGSEQQASR